MSESFDGFEWRPLRAALRLSAIAEREFEKRKLTKSLTSLTSRSIGELMKREAADEASFREALEQLQFPDTDIEEQVQRIYATV